MKRYRKYEELLSAYLDNSLSGEDTRFVEETLLKDPEWMKRYEEMRALRLKMLSLSSQKSENDSLWPAVSRRIREMNPTSEKIEFLPARLVPVMVVLVMIIVGLSSFYITRNWDAVIAYFDDARAVVEDISEQGIVRGALQPLFAGVTNDDMMRFALSGILEIPDADGQGLRVESEADDQFELEFSDARKAREAPSLSELYAELDVTDNQMKSIDSLLTEYKDIVRSSVFIAGDEEVVISPEIAGLNKFIIASVAQKLDPSQLVKFNRVLSRYNPEIQVPHAGAFQEIAVLMDAFQPRIDFQMSPPPDAPPSPRTEVRARVEAERQLAEARKREPRTFLVIRPDTIITREFNIPDFEQFTEHLPDAEKIQRTVSVKVAKALENTRIHIQPQVDVRHEGRQVIITTRVDRPDRPDKTTTKHMLHLDSLFIDQFSGEHFIRLRELSKQMQAESDFWKQHMQQFVGPDTIRIPEQFNPFDESFERNMKQLEFDLERLGEELEKLFKDPEKLMFMRDSLYFHLFPDTLN